MYIFIFHFLYIHILTFTPLLTIANIKIRFSYKMKNDTPFMTEPCKSIHLPKRCKSITANGINYISTLQNRYKCTKTSSTVNVIPPNLLTSEKHLCCLIIQWWNKTIYYNFLPPIIDRKLMPICVFLKTVCSFQSSLKSAGNV